jgi:5-methylthioribose kinase
MRAETDKENGGAFAGGVSSDLALVDGPDGAYVVKAARPRLKVRADWRSDPRRAMIEAAALETMADVLGEACVPRVLWSDAKSHRFAMSLVPARFRNWKTLLVEGETDPATARRAGELLGQLHRRTAGRDDLAKRFDDRTFLVELRIEPFFRRVAERNPDLAAAIEEMVERMLSTRLCLVHGDYSPKNMLVDGAAVVLLDAEVAHWGDPRFDVAFCLSHLLLGTICFPAFAGVRTVATTAFLDAYAREGLPVLDGDLMRQTGCLMLARVDGDSPLDYIDDPVHAATVRRIARKLILEPPNNPHVAPELCRKLAA